MKILNHRLCEDDGTAVRFEESPNQSGDLVPDFLVMHFTAGSSYDSSIVHLTNPAAKASAHLVIGRNGQITQLVPFDKVAWHAGRSRWRGRTGLNRHSIGIELDNAGRLDWQGGAWRAWFGRSYPEEEVAVAAHKHEGVQTGWHLYTENQISAALAAAQAIAAEYEIDDVLGHDDIAPERKQDPGPAFPMDRFRARVVGRHARKMQTFITMANLNIRTGPGIAYDRLRAHPLPKGTRVTLISTDASWCFVEVANEAGDADLTGWVHGDYLT